MQHKSFQEFKNEREYTEFTKKFNSLCEAIAANQCFDNFWCEVAIPSMVNQTAADEEQLLNEFLDGLKKYNPFARRTNGPATKDNSGQVNSWLDGQQPPQNPKDVPMDAQVMGQPRQASASQRQGVDQSIAKIKQDFANAMRSFLQTTQNSAKQSNDWISSKVAQSFYNQIMKQANNYNMNVNIGGRDASRDGFERSAGAMQQNNMANMKQGLMNKNAADPSRLGRQRTVQGAGDYAANPSGSPSPMDDIINKYSTTTNPEPVAANEPPTPMPIKRNRARKPAVGNIGT